MLIAIYLTDTVKNCCSECRITFPQVFRVICWPVFSHSYFLANLFLGRPSVSLLETGFDWLCASFFNAENACWTEFCMRPRELLRKQFSYWQPGPNRHDKIAWCKHDHGILSLAIFIRSDCSCMVVLKYKASLIPCLSAIKTIKLFSLQMGLFSSCPQWVTVLVTCWINSWGNCSGLR